MKPNTLPAPQPARALANGSTSGLTTAAEAVKETAVAALGASIDRILRLMRECDDPNRKLRLNDTLYLATLELAAVLRSQPGRSVDQ